MILLILMMCKNTLCRILEVSILELVSRKGGRSYLMLSERETEAAQQAALRFNLKGQFYLKIREQSDLNFVYSNSLHINQYILWRWTSLVEDRGCLSAHSFQSLLPVVLQNQSLYAPERRVEVDHMMGKMLAVQGKDLPTQIRIEGVVVPHGLDHLTIPLFVMAIETDSWDY